MTTPRLTAEQRRAQIVDVGAEAFAAHHYADVRMDEVARAAAISRALLYRHFPTKSDLFVAVFRDAVGKRLSDTAHQAQLPLRQQLGAGLDAHLAYFAANRTTVLAANREMAGDPTVRALVAEEFGVLRDRLLATPELRDRPQDSTGALVMSWLVFVRVLCVEWLDTGVPAREEVRAMCIGALLGALGDVS